MFRHQKYDLLTHNLVQKFVDFSLSFLKQQEVTLKMQKQIVLEKGISFPRSKGFYFAST